MLRIFMSSLYFHLFFHFPLYLVYFLFIIINQREANILATRSLGSTPVISIKSVVIDVAFNITIRMYRAQLLVETNFRNRF
jgi:hypothetical protein